MPSRTSKLIQFNKHLPGTPQWKACCWALGDTVMMTMMMTIEAKLPGGLPVHQAVS